MTAAQKTAKAKFKQAIAYRQKTGVSLKEAFAHIYGKKVGAVKKKAVVKKKAAKKVVKKVTGIKQDKKLQAKKPGKRVSDGKHYPYKKGNVYYENRPNRMDRGKLLGIYNIGELFDISAIKDLDALKKQYIKLSKKYHPDAGGTTIQFQQLQNEYNILLNKILNNSQLNQSQKQNEKDLDLAIREIVDNLINIDGLNVELIGKWLWISGNTYPVKTILKQAGLTFIKKEGNPFWVYKGVESTSRGQSSMEEIRKKYGVYKIEVPKFKKIGVIVRINKTKLKSAINKAKKALDKRPI